MKSQTMIKERRTKKNCSLKSRLSFQLTWQLQFVQWNILSQDREQEREFLFCLSSFSASKYFQFARFFNFVSICTYTEYSKASLPIFSSAFSPQFAMYISLKNLSYHTKNEKEKNVPKSHCATRERIIKLHLPFNFERSIFQVCMWFSVHCH